MVADFRHYEWLDPVAPRQAQPHRTTFRLNLNSKTKERTAQPFERDELRRHKQNVWLIREPECVTVQKLSNIFNGTKQLVYRRDVLASSVRLNRAHVAGEWRYLFRVAAFIFTTPQFLGQYMMINTPASATMPPIMSNLSGVT